MGSALRFLSVRVLAIIDSLGGGGTERSLAELIPPLADRGIEITVAVLRPGGTRSVESLLHEQGTPLHFLPAGPRRVPAFRGLTAEVAPDVVHSMLYAANLTARLAGIGSSVPVLTSLVNTSYAKERLASVAIPRWKVRVVQVVDALTGRFLVDGYHAVSEAVAIDAVAHLRVPRDRITVVHRGRRDPLPTLAPESRSDVRAGLGIPIDAPVVVNVGRHERQKDHATLLRSMAPLLEARPDLRLVIAGKEGGETGELRARCRDLASGDRVLLLGHRDDVPAVLAASDLFVLTSRHEGLPGAVIEAMAVGLPVVASDIGPVREVVGSGVGALTAPVGDDVAFGAAVGSLLDDPARARELGRRGRARFEADFTIDASADGMASLYRAVAERSSR